jgi:hypothetical protein
LMTASVRYHTWLIVFTIAFTLSRRESVVSNSHGSDQEKDDKDNSEEEEYLPNHKRRKVDFKKPPPKLDFINGIRRQHNGIQFNNADILELAAKDFARKNTRSTTENETKVQSLFSEETDPIL